MDNIYLGMKGRIDPNSSVSLRTKVHRNGINGPNKEKIKFFQNLQQKTLDNISELYIDFYMQIWQMTQLVNQQECLTMD